MVVCSMILSEQGGRPQVWKNNPKASAYCIEKTLSSSARTLPMSDSKVRSCSCIFDLGQQRDGACYAEIGRQSCGTRPQTRQDAVTEFCSGLPRSFSFDRRHQFSASAIQRTRFLARALRVVCIAQLAH